MNDVNLKAMAARIRWLNHPWKSMIEVQLLKEFYLIRMMTQKEIAIAVGCSQKAIQTAMRKFGIPPRKSIPRCQAGVLNSKWKGSRAGYQAKHLRVQTLLGKPMTCEVCQRTGPGIAYEWANLTGNYDDPKDYRRMCRSCHRKYDNARRRIANP